jgi:hypothetical protein
MAYGILRAKHAWSGAKIFPLTATDGLFLPIGQPSLADAKTEHPWNLHGFMTQLKHNFSWGTLVSIQTKCNVLLDLENLAQAELLYFQFSENKATVCSTFERREPEETITFFGA